MSTASLPLIAPNVPASYQSVTVTRHHDSVIDGPVKETIRVTEPRTKFRNNLAAVAAVAAALGVLVLGFRISLLFSPCHDFSVHETAWGGAQPFALVPARCSAPWWRTAAPSRSKIDTPRLGVGLDADLGESLGKDSGLSIGSSSAKAKATVSVDRRATKQTILGFGGAFTEAAAATFAKLSPAAQEAVLEAYWGESGIGYTMGRVPINSCDFSEASYNFDAVGFECEHNEKAKGD